jgi:hypothetical protein
MIMGTANQRIPVLVTEEEKARIAKKAKKAGLSVGEYLRRAAASYDSPDDEEALDAMINQMLIATDAAEKAIDDAIAFVEASNQRIEKLEKEHQSRKVA